MLDTALREFHARDWQRDVEILDRELAVDGALSADLKTSPPSIITGDPFKLGRGKCLLVVGINPGWPRDEITQQKDCQRASDAWKAGYDHYRSDRQSYFAEAAGPVGRTKNADERYNSRHFSRLGNTISKALKIAPPGWEPGPTARALFRERAAIFDLVPYWSADTRMLDLNKHDLDQQDCLAAWKRVLSAFIEEKRPRAIVVNNCGKRTLIEEMLDCRLAPVPDTSAYAALRNGDGDTPIIAHPFLSSWHINATEYERQFASASCFLDVSLSTVLARKLVAISQ